MSEERPTSVVVIGWYCIVQGGLAILGILVMAFRAVMFHDSNPIDLNTEAFWILIVTFIVMLGSSAVFTWAGWAFTQCRSWARKILLFFNWPGLMGHIVLTIITLRVWQSSDSPYVTLAIRIAFIVVTVIMLGYLHSSNVKRAMQFQ